jgi:dynein heavy chain
LKVRWAESVNVLDEKLSGLVGDTLIAAAAVAYIGPFTATYRKELISNWLQLCGHYTIPISKTFDLVKSTVDAYQVSTETENR